jgi:hypothetical protein
VVAAAAQILSITGAAPVAIAGAITKGGALTLVITSTNSSTLTLTGTSSILTLNLNGGAASIVDLGSTGLLTIANGETPTFCAQQARRSMARREARLFWRER